MATANIGVVWFLGPTFAILLACSSTQNGARGDGSAHIDGVGGSGGDGGSGEREGSGGRGGAGTGGATSDVRFVCGDASCSVPQEYCRDLASRGGASGNSGSDPNSNHALSCVPFGDCVAHDCSCVDQYYLNYRCGCFQPDAGGTFSGCGQI